MTISFAVVIPTHQRPDLVVQAVDSVLAQTYAANEIVVVVDGPDPRVVAALAGKPVLVLEQDQAGEAAARNAGVRASTAEWVTFLDDDDLWHPDRLARTAAEIESNDTLRAIHAPSWSFSDGPLAGAELVARTLTECIQASSASTPTNDMTYLDIEGRSFDLLLERNRGNIGTASVRRDVLERAGLFPVGYSCAADWVMFANVARFTEWRLIDYRLSFVRLHGGNNTSTSGLTNGIVTMTAVQRLWDEPKLPVPLHRPLVEYGPHYRVLLQTSLWMAIRARRLDLVRKAIRVGLPLLPRWRDRLFAALPLPVTWRFERAIRAGRRLKSSR